MPLPVMAAYGAYKVGSLALKTKAGKKLGAKAIKGAKGLISKVKKKKGGVKLPSLGKGRAAATGGRKRQSAKQRLKKAYERRALRNIRLMRLGAARKDLYKKATVL